MKCDRALPHGGPRRPCRALRGAYTNIAYNSCLRNRHCPKCQGAAAQQWLAEREAELLPVPYFHVVFTLPARIASIAYQNKAVVYDLLFKASSEAVLTIVVVSRAPGRPHRHHRRAPHLGLDHAPSPACPHGYGAGRRHRLEWEAMAVVPAPLLAARARAHQAVPGADASQAPRRAQGRPAQILRPTCSPRRAQGLRGLPDR